MKEKSTENSQQQADILMVINTHIELLDTEYLKECASDMQNDASRQSSMAALNRNFNPEKIELMYQQAEALNLLCQYRDALQTCSTLKTRVQTRDRQMDEISKMFF